MKVNTFHLDCYRTGELAALPKNQVSLLHQFTMAPVDSPYTMRSDLDRDHFLEPHFNQTEQVAACDHCIYFRGIVCRSTIKQNLTDDDEIITRYNNMADGPRSLLSVAIEEETVERREQTKYTAWIRSMAAASAAVETKGADMMVKSVVL